MVILFVVLSALAVGSLAFAALAPRMASEKKTAARLSQYSRVETNVVAKNAARDRVAETARRRKSIQNSLKDIDDREKARARLAAKPSLGRRITQAGLAITERQFVLFSAISGVVLSFVMLAVSGSLIVALGSAFVGGVGLPRFALNFLRKRRTAAFIEEFPNAIDLVVRGVRSGLPVNDTLRMIATETAEPVRGEFRKVVEAQQLGLSTAEAVERLYQNMPLPETNFFSIVIAIQAQAGGNLSEALANLSRVLRERKKMKAKVQVMSMEAKSSAGIIGSLPLIVAGLIHLMTPDYIAVLFTTTAGNAILVGSAIWMSIGVFVMRQMINFDF